MGTREPLLQDVIGILVGVGGILFGLTPRSTLGYPAGDVRATPEYSLIVTVLCVGSEAFFVVVCAVRLIQGQRGGR